MSRRNAPYLPPTFALLLCVSCAAPGGSGSSARPKAPPHPLDPLSAEEIRLAAQCLRAQAKTPQALRFPLIALDEPTKAELAAHRDGSMPQRRALAFLLDLESHKTSEAIVDLSSSRVIESRVVREGQAALLEEEYGIVEELVRADARWQEAIRKRGISDLTKVLVDVWAPGAFDNAAYGGARLARALTFDGTHAENAYGAPVEGVVALVNLDTRAVVELLDTGSKAPLAKPRDFDATPPTSLTPLEIRQPLGPSFRMDGRELRWAGWEMRLSFHPREGVVFHKVSLADGPTRRSVLHRAAVSEMVVPYGDPADHWSWRSAFDEGEYHFGRMALTLVPGRDVPSNAIVLDALVAGDDGEPLELPSAIAIHERDGGLLWKHADSETSVDAARRSRELVVSFGVVIGNYDYLFHWIFREDGILTVETELTGILLGKGTESLSCEACPDLSRGETAPRARGDERFGTLVERHIVAPNHQHLFNFRLDFDIDGIANSAAELTTRSLDIGPENPRGNAFVMETTLLRDESAAQRDLDLRTNRHWKIFSPSSHTPLGHLRSFVLAPGHNSIPYQAPGSMARTRAAFAEHALWVTRQRESELYAAGNQPGQRATKDGLPLWSNGEPIVGEDLVLWYSMGVTHHPRPEEWPIMPTAHASFQLVPLGFFDENPVAPPARSGK